MKVPLGRYPYRTSANAWDNQCVSLCLIQSLCIQSLCTQSPMASWYSWYLIANSISSKGCSSLFHDWFPKLMYHWKEKLTGNPCICWVNDLPQIKPVSVCSKSNLRKRIFSSKTPHMGPKFPLNILSNGWFTQKQQQFGWIWWFPGSSSSQIPGGA